MQQVTTIDISGITGGTYQQLNCYNNPLLTSFTLPSVQATFGRMYLDNNAALTDISISPNTLNGQVTAGYGIIRLYNSGYVNIDLPESLTFPIAGLEIHDVVDLDSTTLDITGLGTTALEGNGIGLSFQNSVDTVAEVNRILVEIDGITTGGYTGRTIDISGTNAAPDSTSGGFDGDAAITSLQGKGFTVTVTV